MSENNKLQFAGILRKKNSKYDGSPFQEPTQIRYFELDILHMTFGYKTKKDDEEPKKIFGFKQVLTYSLDISNDEKAICEWIYGFYVKLLGNKTYILFCENIDDLLRWMEGFRLFFEKKNQRLIKKLMQSNNDKDLNSSNINLNQKIEENRIFLVSKEINTKRVFEEERKSSFNQLSRKGVVEIEILGNVLRRKETTSQNPQPLNSEKVEDFNLICNYTAILEKKLIASKYKTVYLKKIYILFTKLASSRKTEFLKHLFIVSKTFSDHSKPKNIAKKHEKEPEDWEIDEILDVKKSSNQSTVSKELLKKELLQVSRPSRDSLENKLKSSKYKIKLVNHNDDTVLAEEENLFNESTPSKTENIAQSKPIISQRNQKDVVAELNENELLEKSPLETVKRSRAEDLNEKYAVMENRINIIHSGEPVNNILPPENNPLPTVSQPESKEVKSKTKVLNLDLINTEEDIGLDQPQQDTETILPRSKSERKIPTKKAIEANNKEIPLEQLKSMYTSGEIRAKQLKSKPKSDLNISGMSAKTFASISSPHFGNISIIAQRFNKVDNIDDWKDYVNYQPGNLTERMAKTMK